MTEPTVLKETRWMQDEDLTGDDAFGQLTALVLLGNGCHCIVCGKVRPDDARWPQYALELEHKRTGESSGDIGYTACPEHEARMDAILEQFA